ncbi:hypothetical protein Pse7367_0511 [Thalassoporum mexicanum PCC 7367]|uniref:hypothetical protein n=1 Tax=Thalassoporum mexicanum TaxID=3457544 RepID=UPI00029FE5CD|nr:hypothetical protein [Pseudanabaena sp. PCC 7367]AFY68819.1 hypothetical protein Pse7367_0511 [Pseudanabaena sp. PCC 7367]
MANSNQPDQENQFPVDSEKQRREAEAMHDIMLLLEHMTQREKVTIELIVDRLYDVGATNLIEQKIHSQRLQKTIKPIARSPMSKSAVRIAAWYWFKQNCPKLITDWLYTKVSFGADSSNSVVAEVKAIANGEQAPVDLPINRNNGSNGTEPSLQVEQMATPPSSPSVVKIETEPVNGAARNRKKSGNNKNGDRNYSKNHNGQTARPAVNSTSAIVLAKSRINHPDPEAMAAIQEIENLQQRVRLLTSALVVMIVAFSSGTIWLGHRLGLKPADIFSDQSRTTLIDDQGMLK